MKINLLHKPIQFRNLSLARSLRDTASVPLMVILGEDEKFWLVCPADASLLQQAGYELTK